MLSVVAIVLVVLLVRDPAGRGSAVPSEEEIARLKVEAIAAAENLFDRINQADATGNPELLDGIYLPGSTIAETQKGYVRERTARGELSIIQSRVTGTQVLAIDRLRASVGLTYIVTGGEVRDSKTGRLKRRVTKGSTTIFAVTMQRIDGRWLIDGRDQDKP